MDRIVYLCYRMNKMLRKVVHITLIILLLATSTGMTFYTHYCGSTFESVRINAVPHSCCGNDCPCCHNKSIIVKIQDHYSASQFNFDFQANGLTLLEVRELLITETIQDAPLFAVVSDFSPPPIQTILSSLQTYRL